MHDPDGHSASAVHRADPTLPMAWLALAFGRGRQVAAAGEDASTTRYGYDTHVPNHGRVAVGDVLLIRGPRELQGCARIRRIEEETATKRRLACPVCRGSAVRAPESGRHATYRCERNHAFAEPVAEKVMVTRFTAFFDGSYVPARGAIDLHTLRAACTAWNGQHAIQPIDLERIHSELVTIPGFRERVLDRTHRPELSPDEASLLAAYVPGHGDMRAIAHRQIRERRGPVRFRRALIARYGARCLVSGCDLRDLLEAVHIRPFRGPGYDAVENGLLLRTDLHTLFDLDLLGIDPETLTVRVHPSLAAAGYDVLESVPLQCGANPPSIAALELRWLEFVARLRRP